MGCCGGKDAAAKKFEPAKFAWKVRKPAGVPEAKHAEFDQRSKEVVVEVTKALKKLEEAPEKLPKFFEEFKDEPMKVPDKLKELLSDPKALLDKIGVPTEILEELKDNDDGAHFVECLACGCVRMAKGESINKPLEGMINCFNWKKSDKQEMAKADAKPMFRELVFVYIRAVMENLIAFVRKMLTAACQAIGDLILDQVYDVSKELIEPQLKPIEDMIPDEDLKKKLGPAALMQLGFDKHKANFIKTGDRQADKLTNKAVECCAVLEDHIADKCFEPWWSHASGGKDMASFNDLKKHMHGFEKELLKKMRTGLAREELMKKLEAGKYGETVGEVPFSIVTGMIPSPEEFVTMIKEIVTDEMPRLLKELAQEKAKALTGGLVG